MKPTLTPRALSLLAALALIVFGVTLYAGCARAASEPIPRAGMQALPEIEGEEVAVLTSAPNVPPPITRRHAMRVIVHLATTEQTKRLADGVEYTFWTFGGDVPGKFIRVRQGDEVEFRLKNQEDSKMPHNIDLHAVTGPGGGAVSSFTAPGKTSVFRFRALKAGLYLYHCATAPVGLHVANGMYGLILVEPPEGLPPVDKEFYVMQSEFYTAGKHGEPGLQAFSLEKAVQEEPEYVVFNGSVGALMENGALQAETGERVRIYVGNGGPNLTSSFHVIGEVFDDVYGEGGTSANQHNVQTTMVPAGGSAIVEFTVDVPGTYTIVDHSLFRAFNKGAVGMLRVTGAERTDLFSGPMNLEAAPLGIDPEAEHSGPSAGAAAPVAPAAPPSPEALAARGASVFSANCSACHGAEGLGMPGAVPPLAQSDFLMADKARALDIVLHGRSGPITVNGKTYNSTMPVLPLSDDEVAAVLTFVRTRLNRGDAVMPDEVRAARAAIKR